jgi:hypothetical protein
MNSRQIPFRAGKWRWGYLALAAWGTVQTPSAVMGAIHLAQSDHILIPVILLAFAIRFSMIGFLAYLWRICRPLKGDIDSPE